MNFLCYYCIIINREIILIKKINSETVDKSKTEDYTLVYSKFQKRIQRCIGLEMPGVCAFLYIRNLPGKPLMSKAKNRRKGI